MSRISIKPLILIAGICCSLVFQVGCAKSVVRKSIPVKHGQTIDEKVEFARGLVTQKRFILLKAQLLERIPGLTLSQLDNLGLRWDVRTFKSFTGKGTRTDVVVSVLCRMSKGLDHNTVINTAIEILEPEVNPPNLLGPVASPKPDATSESEE